MTEPDSEVEDAFAPSSSSRQNEKLPSSNSKAILRPTATTTTGPSTDSETESDDDDADFDDPFVGIYRPVNHYHPKLSTEPRS